MRAALHATVALALAGGLCLAPATTPIISAAAPLADPVQTAVWTASSYESIFTDALPTAASPRTLSLAAARNEYEAGQILIRKDRKFTVSGVDFGSLTAGTHVLSPTSMKYQFVDYTHLNHNSVFGGNQAVDLVTRPAPGDFPDGLSNDTTRTIAANSTQPIWIKAYVPKGTAPGRYAGTATVRTDQGNSAVAISVDVKNVTIPDAQNSGFTTSLWSLTTGPISWDEGAGDTIELAYGEKRYSPKWWTLMESFAADMKQYRNNDLTVNVVRLLLDGGSSVGADGKYTFNWSRFDQFIKFFMDRGAVKRLEGFWMSGYALNRPVWQTELIGRDANGKPIRQYVDTTSQQTTDWIKQFIPALKQHLTAKGWADKWWMHVSDETPSGEVNQWEALATRIRAQWSDVRLADAVVDQNSAQALASKESFLIPNEMIHDPNTAFYDAQVAAGKQVWLYNCNVPIGMSLNRFVDQPEYDQRLTMWYAYEHGISGYLHWAFNNWQYKIDDQDVKGDGYIVLPDKKHNTLESTIRYESLRDGLEDRELLAMVGKKNPALAQGLAHSVVTGATRYSRDTAYMQRIRTMLLAAAAGGPVLGAAISAGHRAQKSTVSGKTALTLDLGTQSQLDAVTVAGAPKAVQIQVSYDSRKWTTAYAGDGAFAGLNAKGRYVRVLGGGSGISVGGFRLPSANLAGGKTYTLSSAPSHPDNSSDSTNGVLAGQFADGRSYGYDLSDGDSKTVDVAVDLGAAKNVADIKVHRYEDYEYRYSPDEVSVATSADGVHFTPKGKLRSQNVHDGVWYDFDFPGTKARYLRVSFTKTYAGGADALFIDEVEAYGPKKPADTDVALGRPYTKSAEPDDPMFVDTKNAESTDGVISGDFTDRYSYAYYLDGGQTKTVSIIVDLGQPIAVDQVRFRKYDDGDHNYAPDRVAVYTRSDSSDFQLRGQTTWPTGSWFDVPFKQSTVSYVRIDITKTQARLADYMFVDEIAVMGDLAKSPVNLALHRPYTKTTDGLDPAYPDTNDADSTDGFIAAGYPDHKSYGYNLSSGQTKTIDVDVDLGSSHSLQLVKFWRYNDGVHHYEPDSLTVLTSDDGTTYTKRATTSTPGDRWFGLALSNISARYVRLEATKTYGYFADYIFVDEIEIYGK